MSFLLSLGLRTAAGALLSKTFTRSTHETVNQQIDDYKDLNKKFEFKELNPSKVTDATPKEQFLNSIGDGGTSLTGENQSLYQRLTDDMKVVVNSNYEVYNKLNDSLSEIKEDVEVINKNLGNVGEAVTTYGSMNMETALAAGQKKPWMSKFGEIFSGLGQGITKILGIVGGLGATIVKGIVDFISDKPTDIYFGEKGSDPDVDETTAELEVQLEQLEAEKKEASQAHEQAKIDFEKENKSSDLSRFTSNNNPNKNVINDATLFVSDMATTYQELHRGDSSISELSDTELYNRITSEMGESLYVRPSGDNKEFKDLSNDDISQVISYIKKLAEVGITKDDLKNIERDISEVKDTLKTSNEVTGYATYAKAGIPELAVEWSKLDSELKKSLGSRSPEVVAKSGEISKEYQEVSKKIADWARSKDNENLRTTLKISDSDTDIAIAKKVISSLNNTVADALGRSVPTNPDKLESFYSYMSNLQEVTAGRTTVEKDGVNLEKMESIDETADYYSFPVSSVPAQYRDMMGVGYNSPDLKFTGTDVEGSTEVTTPAEVKVEEVKGTESREDTKGISSEEVSEDFKDLKAGLAENSQKSSIAIKMLSNLLDINTSMIGAQSQSVERPVINVSIDGQ